MQRIQVVAPPGRAHAYQVPLAPSYRQQELSAASPQAPPPVGATMHTIEQSTFEDICSAKKHASYHHITRSVPGMKNLLPLRLLSPTLPEINAWPSSAPNNRSTFGMSLVQNIEDRDGTSREQTEDEEEAESKCETNRLKSYRDIPIYTEPGSPLLNRAYLTDEEVHASCNTSESDEWFEVYDYSTMGPETSDCLAKSSQTENPIQDMVENELGDMQGLQKNPIPSTNRNSGLSFQCSGEAEALFSNEAAWLRSPLDYNRIGNPSKFPFQSLNISVEQNVKSWLSDTSSCGDDREDFLSRATFVAPVKAHVVEVNSKAPTGLSIHVPPRSSSLAGTTIIHVAHDDHHDSWLYSAYSPPATPSQPWTGTQSCPPKQNLLQKQFDAQSPQKRPDLAMTSPPASPTHGHRDAFSTPPTWQVPKFAELESKAHSGQSRDLGQAGLSAEAIETILKSLENLTSHCPSGTLQPDTPCVVAIRSQLAPPPAATQKPQNAPDTAFSPSFPSNFLPQPEPTLHRRQTTNFSKPRRTPSAATSKSCPAPRNMPPPTPTLPSFYVSQSNITSHASSSQNDRYLIQLPPPDTQPLQRIFPKSTKFMQTSLYALVLAHIFLSSLSVSTKQKMPRFSKKRRDTPYWPTTDAPSKAADVLGIGYRHIASRNEDGFEGADFGKRVEGAKERVRMAIKECVEEVEGKGGKEGMEGALGLLFIRGLEEVVRACETDTYRYF